MRDKYGTLSSHFYAYLDRGDTANERHDITEHVIRVEEQGQRVRHMASNDLY